MATAGDGSALTKAAERKKITTGVLDQGGSSASVSAATGISELEEMLRQKTFTRSEIQHPTTLENLPGDLLSNIFIRLLAKQVARMRCVSKSWNAPLSESSFVKSHLYHSINNNDRVFLVFYNEASPSNPLPFTVHPCRSPHLELSNLIKLPTVNPKSGHTGSGIGVIGSVHGLICFSYGDDVIHIWNPSLSVASTLPPHYIPSGGSYDISFRFGYDPKTDDYKVVKLVGLTGTVSSNAIKEWLQVEVYSMRKGSWKSITQSFPSHDTWIDEGDYSCVDGHDGHLHWIAYIDKEKMILAFDLSSETFHEIPFPDSVLDGHHANDLGVLGGKLCVMSCYKFKYDVCEVWEMDEYRVAESWVKHHVPLRLFDDIVYGFTLHNEFLIVRDDCHLVLYDPTANKAKILDKDCRGNYSADKIVEYVNSLVWIAPAKLEMVDGAEQN